MGQIGFGSMVGSGGREGRKVPLDPANFQVGTFLFHAWLSSHAVQNGERERERESSHTSVHLMHFIKELFPQLGFVVDSSQMILSALILGL